MHEILILIIITVKAAALQIQAKFHDNFAYMYLIVKYCETNKESNLHIAKGTYVPHLLPIFESLIFLLSFKILVHFSQV
jgi:hypothetical protein